jgi:hypothetical protein
MIRLSAENVTEFLDRFYQCYDGVIRKVTVDKTVAGTMRRAQIVVSVQDKHGERNEGWVNLRLELDGLKRAPDKPMSLGNQVVDPFGLQIGFFGNEVYLDFAPHTDKPTALQDFEDSDCLFVADSCSWQVTDYREDVETPDA